MISDYKYWFQIIKRPQNRPTILTKHITELSCWCFYDPLFCQWNLTQTPYCCVVFVFFFYVISDKRFVSMLFIVCGLNHFCFSYSLWSFISCKKASHSLLSPMITPSHRQWCDGGSDNKKKHKICPYQKHTPLWDRSNY